ncbi:MAG TPA: hypothetical protein VK484_14240 [Ferruginibacter sp.]|nr:hypothetical protein [Ferruginibacter sp.]
MKQIKFGLLLAALCFFFLESCQKEYSIDNGNTPVSPSGNDSFYLDRITEVYYIPGDSTIQDFLYDNQKRIKSISKKSYQNNTLIDTSVITLFYNGNDSLPFKLTDYLAVVGVFTWFDSTINFLFYDAQGRMILDSSIHSSQGTGSPYHKDKDIYSVKYVANNIYGYNTSTNLSNPNPPSIQVDTTWLDANKNILKRHFYDSQPLALFRTEDNTSFDNKLSPYFYMKQIPYFYVTSPYYTGMNNLLITHTEKLYIPAIYDVKYVHTYNAYNMPILSIGIDIPTQAVEEKIYYKYRSL